MARVQNTLIGRASGSVGEVVFLTWRLINVTRSKPSSVANPDTILQQQQRNRFGATVALYRILKEILAVGLKNRNRKMTLFNFFQRLNQQNCFDNVGDGSVAFLPESLIISYGLVGKIYLNTILASSGSTTCVLRTSNIYLVGQSNFDRMYIVGFNENTNEWALNIATQNRQTLNKVLSFSTSFTAGDRLHVWWFSATSKLKNITQTNYAVKIV